MRKLIHVSDFHFGSSDTTVVDGLVAAIGTLAPQLVIISGDLTQRARKREFESAQRYFDTLRQTHTPFLVIPGNHDIAPLYHPVRRIFNSYRNYKKYISEFTEPQYADVEIVVASINSVTPVRPSGGRFRIRDARRAGEWLSRFPDSMMKIIVTHHPIHAPNEKATKRAFGGNRTLKALKDSRIDLFLAGHYHRSMIQTLSSLYDYGGLAVQAGTVSRRLRGEQPSFNVLTIDKPHLTFEAHRWDAPRAGFHPAEQKEFVLHNAAWVAC